MRRMGARTELIEAVEEAGSDHLATFGGRFEGGYNIQQDPGELADLVLALSGRGLRSYLQVGSAAGGSERFLCERLCIPRLTIVDDGKHPKFPVWTSVNRPALAARGVAISQYIGDSHGRGARRYLARRRTRFDLVGIDGDHSPAGVRSDWELVQPCLRPGTLVWFHDLAAERLPPGQRGAARVWRRLRERHEVVLETVRRLGIGLLRIR